MNYFFRIASIAMAIATWPLTAVEAQHTPAGNFVITGTVQGLQEGVVVFNRYGADGVVTDTVSVTDAVFIYKGRVEEPQFTSITLPSKENDRQEFYFFTEQGHFRLHVRYDTISQSMVTGSPVNDLYFQYQHTHENILKTILAHTYSYLSLEDKVHPGQTTHDTLAVLNAAIDSLNEILFIADTAFVSQYPQSYISLYRIEQDMKNGMPVEIAADLFHRLSGELKNSGSGIRLKNTITHAQQYAIGKSIPGVQLKNKEGRNVDVMTVVRKNKYTLLEFWASWCVPCRQEVPFLKEAYAGYHEKGFHIFSISSDIMKRSWLQALQKMQLPWTNVIIDNNMPRFYQMNAIPFNLLVNNKGIIVARDLRGEKLDKKLKELLN